MQGWEIPLVLVYTALFSLLLFRFRWWSIEGIPRLWIVGGFWVKVAAAIAYGLLHHHLYGEWSDTFMMYDNGVEVLKLLPEQPDIYLRIVFGPNNVQLPETYHLLGEGLGYWGDTGSHMVVRLHALFGLFSFGSYYGNAVFMAFLTWGGLLALIRVFCRVFDQSSRVVFLFALLLPTVLFFGSGFHKEGLVIIALGLIFLGVQNLLERWRWPALLMVLIGGALLAFIKAYYLAAAAPAVLGLLWTNRFPKLSGMKFILVALVFWAALFNVHHILPQFNLPSTIETKQEEFMSLEGASNIPIANLDPSLGSIAQTLPRAAANTFLRPYPSDIHNWQMALYALETWVILLFVLLALIFPKRTILQNPWWWAILVSSVAASLIIGLIVPNLGAIARYQSPAWLIFAVAWFVAVDWNRWKKVLTKRIGMT